MRRSKLQVNIAILHTLAQNGESIPTHIVYDSFLNSSLVNECLAFLLNQELVQECNEGKRRSYDITDSGLKALRVAKEIDKALHVFNVA
jgi:predicted transcriptional regulator